MGKLLTAGLAALALAAAPARADDPKPGADRAAKMFKRLDTNGDGKLSLDEFKKIADRPQSKLTPERAEQLFRRLDANKDGFLSLDELKAFTARLRQRKP